jgi:hypothetical protein
MPVITMAPSGGAGSLPAGDSSLTAVGRGGGALARDGALEFRDRA